MSEEPAEHIPLYMLCVEHEGANRNAIAYACEQARQNGGRIGLFSTLDLDEFQNWATVEDTMKQELREQREKDLWSVAGLIREQFEFIPEFYIGEGAPLSALSKIIETDQNVKLVIVSLVKKDLEDYMDSKIMKKLTIPVVFVPDSAI